MTPQIMPNQDFASPSLDASIRLLRNAVASSQIQIKNFADSNSGRLQPLMALLDRIDSACALQAVDVYSAVRVAMTWLSENAEYDAFRRECDIENEELASRIVLQWQLLRFALIWHTSLFLRRAIRQGESVIASADAEQVLNNIASKLSGWPVRGDGLLDNTDFENIAAVCQAIQAVPFEEEELAPRTGKEAFLRWLDDISRLASAARDYGYLVDNAPAWTINDAAARCMRQSRLPLTFVYLAHVGATKFISHPSGYMQLSAFEPAIDVVAAHSYDVYVSLKPSTANADLVALENWRTSFRILIRDINARCLARRDFAFLQNDLTAVVHARGGSEDGICFGLTLLYAAAEQLRPNGGGWQLLERLRFLYCDRGFSEYPPDSIGAWLHACYDSESRNLHEFIVKAIQTVNTMGFWGQYVAKTSEGFEHSSADIVSLFGETGPLQRNVSYAISAAQVQKAAPETDAAGIYPTTGQRIELHVVFLRNDASGFHYFDSGMGAYKNITKHEAIRLMDLSLGELATAGKLTAGWYDAVRVDGFIEPLSYTGRPPMNWIDVLGGAQRIFQAGRFNKVDTFTDNDLSGRIEYSATLDERNRPSVMAQVFFDGESQGGEQTLLHAARTFQGEVEKTIMERRVDFAIAELLSSVGNSKPALSNNTQFSSVGPQAVNTDFSEAESQLFDELVVFQDERASAGVDSDATLVSATTFSDHPLTLDFDFELDLSIMPDDGSALAFTFDENFMAAWDPTRPIVFESDSSLD